MKKLLALVLALVMTLGLATVSSSAAYSDANDIEYTEAVDVMTAVGVFQGKGDSFAPKDNLNRAEAAKLVAYLMLGNKTAESMTGSGTRFTDVPADHWAAGYIEYLASVGIVSGVGNNQFNPNGQVTAVQFAKMLLVALGYDAELEGFVGEGWSINIQKLANKNDLFDNLDVSTNDALNREQAAQMCLSDLRADMVKYSDKGTTVKIGESTVVTGAKEAAKDEDVGNKNYNHSNDANGDRKYLQLAESLYGNDIDLREGTDNFGRPTNTWNYKNIKVGEYADNAQLIATATAKFSRKSLYDALGKDQYDNIKDGKTALYVYEDGVGGKIAASDVDNYMDRTATLAISNTSNGSLTQVYLNEDGDNDVVRVVTTQTYIWKVSNDYSATRGDITIKSVGDDSGSTSTQINPISLKDRTLKDDDFEEIKDLKKDDYVLITAYHTASTNPFEVDSITKAELLTGNVDAFTKEDTITVDGNKLKYSKMVPVNGDHKQATFSVGESASLVMDKYGYVIAVDEAVVNNNYVFISNIKGTGGLNSNPEADAYFTDGTNEAIRVNKLLTSDSKSTILGTNTDATSGSTRLDKIGSFSNADGGTTSDNVGWYTYSKTSDGKYNLTKVSDDYRQVGYIYDTTKSGDLKDTVYNNQVNFLNATGANAVTSGNASSVDVDRMIAVGSAPAANTLKADDKTIFVVEQDGDVNVYTGLKNAPGVSLTKRTGTATDDKAVVMVTYDKDSLYAKYVFITLTPKASIDGGQNTALLYVLKRDTENVTTNQDDYEMWYVINEEGKAELVKTETNFGASYYRGYFKAYKNNDGDYKKVDVIRSTNNGTAQVGDTNSHYFEAINASSTIDYSNGALSIANKNFSVASDTKIILVLAKTLNKAMMANPDLNYEIEDYTNNGDGLETKFADYTGVTYNVQGRVGGTYPTDTDLKEIYITVTAATKKTTAASSTATTPVGIAGVLLNQDAGAGYGAVIDGFSTATAGEGTLVFYAGSKPSGTDIATAVIARLTEAGYTASASDATVSSTNVTVDNKKSGIIMPDADVVIGKTLIPVVCDDSVTATETLYVPYGETLTLSKAVSAKDVIVDGTLNITSGGSLTVSGNYVVTKRGHATVSGGTLTTGGTSKEFINGSSLVITSGTVNLNETYVEGNLTISGGALTIATTTSVSAGATLSVSGAATLAAGGNVTNDGTISLAGTGTKLFSGKIVPTATGDTTTKLNIAGSGAVTFADDVEVGSLTLGNGVTVVGKDSDEKITVNKNLSQGTSVTETTIDVKLEDGATTTGEVVSINGNVLTLADAKKIKTEDALETAGKTDTVTLNKDLATGAKAYKAVVGKTVTFLSDASEIEAFTASLTAGAQVTIENKLYLQVKLAAVTESITELTDVKVAFAADQEKVDGKVWVEQADDQSVKVTFSFTIAAKSEIKAGDVSGSLQLKTTVDNSASVSGKTFENPAACGYAGYKTGESTYNDSFSVTIPFSAASATDAVTITPTLSLKS